MFIAEHFAIIIPEHGRVVSEPELTISDPYFCKQHFCSGRTFLSKRIYPPLNTTPTYYSILDWFL